VMTCTSTTGEQNLHGVEPTLKAQRHWQDGAAELAPLCPWSEPPPPQSVRQNVLQSAGRGPADKGVATWVGPPPTDDPPEVARAASPTDEEPCKLLKTPADGWMPYSPHSG
jgi:hypothetical protein